MGDYAFVSVNKLKSEVLIRLMHVHLHMCLSLLGKRRDYCPS